MSDSLTKKYGLPTAIAMVVGIVIGSGVFFKAGDVLKHCEGNMPLGIAAWLIGGAIMIFCALGFANMATRYEKINGVVDYAEATVGPKYAYFVGWFFTTIYYPAVTAVLSWVSARYTLVFICTANPDFKLTVPYDQAGAMLSPECLALASFYLIMSYAVNTLSPKLAGKIQVSTTVIKLIPLALIAVVGTIYGIVTGVTAENFVHNASGDFTSATGISPLFRAVIATAFAYDGWIIATSINAELKNAKKNLPIALTVGAVIVVVAYVTYYIGVAGGASNQELIEKGATVAFSNIFGSVFGTLLTVFIAVSCLGTLNGLMLACSRGFYSLAARNEGPKPKVLREVDRHTNMPANSAVAGLMLCAAWLLYFYGANLAAVKWFGVFSFDSSELPIVTSYSLYIPIFVAFMIKAKDLGVVKRFVIPSLAIVGSVFMITAAVIAHGVEPYIIAKNSGEFSFPILFYLIVFAVILVIGGLCKNAKNNDL